MGSGVSRTQSKAKETDPGPVLNSPQRQESTLIIASRGSPIAENSPIVPSDHSSPFNRHVDGLGFNFNTDGNLYNGRDDYTDRLLSHSMGQESPHQVNSIEAPYSGRSGQSDGAAAAEMFAHTALSLGMDNDDLLFNLMYFDDGHAGTFGSVMNNVQTETLALHSENNTPYKLKPATKHAISGLHRKILGVDIPPAGQGAAGTQGDCECAVCKDDIEEGSDVLQIPTCQHFFHEECLLRWINLVS